MKHYNIETLCFFVQPGEVVHESGCKVCICENNHYTCDESACVSTTKKTTTTTTTTTETVPSEIPTTTTEVETISTEVPTTTEIPTTVLIIHSTVSPPPPCDQSR